MQSHIKINMLFKDRIGIVADISRLVAQRNLNIYSMEVAIREANADIYFEMENDMHMPREELLRLLGAIDGLTAIRFIDTLPQELRENRFQVVLDNIRDGVISVDTEGKITTINRVAKRVLGCEHEEVVGKDVKELNLPDFAILDCLRGEKYTNVKKDLITERGRFQYFATGRPITDSADRIVGAVEIGKDMREIQRLAQSISQPTAPTFSDFIGKSPALMEAISFAKKIARTDAVVAIRGESGTGKEVFARAIHAESERKGPFIPVNCGALPETLLESELFGYVSGAFTGARREGKAGLFEIARSGSIFLDEIGEMPLTIQVKILRVIQEKSVRRIGGDQEIPINARIIVATNKNLEELVRETKFRTDLYYRINVLPMHILPLRDRPEDIPLLAEYFLFQLDSRLGKDKQSLSKEASDKLRGHRWPGNVRELKNVIERAAILCDTEEIGSEWILFGFEVGKGVKKEEGCGDLQEPGGHSLRARLDAYEKRIIVETLGTSKSIRQSAKKLGVSHTALLNRIRKYQISMAR
jgi:PAS domain S-box-containing protein/TyrR family helix-turn-helix protein